MSAKEVFDILLEMDFLEAHAEFEALSYDEFASLSNEQMKKAVPQNRLEEFQSKWNKLFNASSDQSTTVCQVVENHEPAPKKRRSNQQFYMENVNLTEILKTTFQGKLLLQLQGTNKHLDQGQRKRLIHIIISGLLTQCERDWEEQDFLIISKKIVELFPKESVSVYFTPYVPKKQSETGISKKITGKLVYKYYNLKKLTKDLRSNLEYNNTTADEVEVVLEASTDVKESIDWLLNKEEPWIDTENHWRNSYSYRQTKIKSVYNKNITAAYQEWPILKTPKGFQLIRIDFELGYFTNQDGIQHFSSFIVKALQVRPLKKNDYFDTLRNSLEDDNIKDDDLHFIQMIILCNILPSNARIRQGPKKYWKPSCAESLDSIVVHVETYGDIEKIKEDRHVFAASKKVTVQPFLIIVGENELDVESVYLCIDSIIYKIPSFLEALDTCFQSFHVFNAKYPAESEHIWQALQIGLYKFRTKWDRSMIQVNELLNDMDYDLLL